MSEPAQLSRRPRFAVSSVVVSVIAVSAVLISPVKADPGSLPASGKLASQTVSGPACASPVGVCATGTIQGTLNGPFEFVGNRLVPADEPDVFMLTGVTVIHDTAGDLRCDDTAVLNAAPGSDGELVGLCELTGLSGKWQGASGYLQTAGTFSPVTGGAEKYVGKIVVP